MNRCYRVVWNAAKEKFQVASELARQRTGGTCARSAACLVLAAGGLLGMAGPAWADGGAGGIGGGNATPASGGSGYEGAAGGQGTLGGFVGGGGGGGGAAGGGLNNGGAGGNGGIGTVLSGGGGGPGGTSVAPNGEDGVDGTSTSGSAGGGGGGGGGGYSGAVFDSNPSLSGNLTGGTGGKGGDGGLSIASPISFGGGGGGGGAGGYGVIVTATGANFSNSHALTGGAGGAGGAGGVAIFPGTGGNGGTGGDGLYIVNGGATIDNTGSGAITGGAGGAGGFSVFWGTSGTGGAGIRGNNLQITNSATISGGSGGAAPAGAGVGGTGGAGIVGDNLQITNSGTISGGVGGAATGGVSTAGVGGAGIVGANLAVTNTGTISGGWNGTAWADAIHFTGGEDNTLTLSGEDWQLNGNLDVDSGSRLTFNQATDQIVANSITGGGSVIQDGDGALTLSGANTYSGGTTVQTGRDLIVGNDHALGTGGVTLDADSFLKFGVDGLSLANDFTLNSHGSFEVNANQTGTISGVIGGGSSDDRLEFFGGGKLVLTNVNTYTGATLIDSGTLALSGAGSIASSIGVDLCDCGTFDISGTNNGATIQDLTGGGMIELGSKTLTISSASGEDYTGVIEGTGGLVIGGGALILSGNNTYQGGTSVASNVYVAVGSDSALGTGLVTMDDRSALVFFSDGLSLNHNFSLANNFKLSGDVGFAMFDGTDTLTGVIGDGTSPGTLDFAGDGKLVLTNINTYTGATKIGSGTLALSGAGSIASSSGVEFDSCGCGDGVFDISATDHGATIQSLQGDAGATVVLGGKTLTLSNASGDYAGTITGTGGLAISGGQEYLTGANTYQGGTTIRGGAILSVSSDANLGDPVGGLTFDDGTLDAYGGFSSARAVSLVGNGAFYVDGGNTLTLSGQVSGPGGLTVTGDGSGKVVLSHANAYSGPTQIEAGTLALSGAGSIAASSGVDICDCGVFDISASSGGGTIQSLSGAGGVKLGGQTLTLSNASGVYTGVISGTGGLALNGGQETLNGSNTYTGGTVVNGGTLSVGDASHPTASILGDVQVNAGGTLRGHGSIAGDVNSIGTVWPGGSIGTLTIGGNYTQSPSGTLQLEVSPTEASQLKVGGTATLAGTLNLLYAPGTYTSTSYTLLSAKAVNGSFATVKSNAPASVAESVVYTADTVDLGLTSTVVTPTQATIFGAVGSSALRAGQGANAALLDRLAGPCGTDSLACQRQGNGLWIQAQGTDTRVDGNNGAPDVRDRRYGFLTGVDRQWKGMTVGVAGGYSHADVTESGNGSKGTLDTLRIAGYGAKNFGAYTLAGTLGYAYDFSSTTRSFGALGSAKGDGHGQEFTAGLQVSRPWSLGPVVLTPRVGVRYAYLDGLSTNETGPTAQNLGVANQHLQSLQPYVGVTLDYPFTLHNNDRPASVQLRAGYAYETQSMGRNVAVTAADGTGFVIAGTRDTRGLLTAGVGATLPIGKSASAYLRYDSVLHTGNVNAQSLQAGVDYRF